jgi:alkylated DNA repair protein alkB family protein 8
MELEENIYNKIYKEFDKSRYSIWVKVKEFLDNLEDNKIILDAGCGNGKYIKYMIENLKMKQIYGIDYSCEFIKLCSEKFNNSNIIFKEMNITNLNFPNNHFDYIISIAVIHHLNPENRIKMIKELVRVVKNNGLILISAWGIIRTDNFKLPNTLKNATKLNDNNDYLIPFKSNNIIYQRYYHLYQNNELFDFISGLNLNIKIIDSCFDRDNFFIILIKSIL